MKRGRNNRNPFIREVYEKENLLEILRKTRKAISSKDTFILANLSDRTIHNASIHQDSDSLAIAVLVYSLARITERPRYAQYREWPVFEKAIIFGIDSAIIHLEKGDVAEFRKDIASIRGAVGKLSEHLKKYIEDVFRKAMITKASRIYEHGISMEQTASLLGITLYELAEYAGKTGIPDVNLSMTLPIQTRLKMAEDFFS